MRTHICTICGDRDVPDGQIHNHNPNGKPIDVIKQFILKNTPSLWEEDE